MANARDLTVRGRAFAEEVKALLSHTVYCDHYAIDAVVIGDGKILVATNLDRGGMMAAPLKLRSSNRFVKTSVWLELLCFLVLDERGFLTVKNSFWAVSVGDSEDELVPLLHFDYERNKRVYAEAHLQVEASHPKLEQYLRDIGRDGRSLSHLHLPVGGRRFRPALEDVIEFLIVEKLVDQRPGWQQALDAGREKFRERQLAAAIWRNEKLAIDTLRDLGYDVETREASKKKTKRRGRPRLPWLSAVPDQRDGEHDKSADR